MLGVVLKEPTLHVGQLASDLQPCPPTCAAVLPTGGLFTAQRPMVPRIQQVLNKC